MCQRIGKIRATGISFRHPSAALAGLSLLQQSKCGGGTPTFATSIYAWGLVPVPSRDSEFQFDTGAKTDMPDLFVTPAPLLRTWQKPEALSASFLDPTG
jgi:hypothetical protein